MVIYTMKNRYDVRAEIKAVEEKVDVISTKIDMMMERGKLRDEEVEEVKTRLHENADLLRQLAYKFRHTIGQQRSTTYLLATVFVLLLFWIVFHI